MRVILLIMLLPVIMMSGTVVQMNDFLCECDYCETVSPGEPLDISRHLIMCHSWRESTMKTFHLMEELRLNDKHGTPIEDTLPTFNIPSKNDTPIVKREPQTIHNDYQWRVHEDHGWTYSTTYQHTLNDEGWMYREDLKWVWLFGDDREFMYSVEHGWFYAFRHNNHRLLYWYDRKYWLLANDFWWKK